MHSFIISISFITHSFKLSYEVHQIQTELEPAAQNREVVPFYKVFVWQWELVKF